MYHLTMNRLNRSPEAGEGGGISATPSAGEGASAGSGAASDTPQYVSRADFDALHSKFEALTRQPRQQEREAPKSEGNNAPKSRPNPKDYKFDTDPDALSKYEDAMEDWRDEQRTARQTKAQAERETKERTEKTERGHNARAAEYAKANPSFMEDVRKAGAVNTRPEITQSIFSHKESPAIVHHLVNNREAIADLESVFYTDGVEAMHQRVGEIAAEIRAARKVQESNINAAKDVPPRQNFRGAAPSKERTKTADERFSDFNN